MLPPELDNEIGAVHATAWLIQLCWGSYNKNTIKACFRKALEVPLLSDKQPDLGSFWDTVSLEIHPEISL